MAHKSLYREWRPESFRDVSGQDHIVKVLKAEIETGRISHAYLFSGPRGTGKTSLAKIFAKAVNCPQRSGAEPCGKCPVCASAASGGITDIVEIDAASNNGVDSVRDLREHVTLMPAACRYKVYIIDEVHMLSAGAFNALLKTLEEPPAHVIFILATTEPHKLPATIRSRCQRFDFARLSVATIEKRLREVSDAEGFKASDEALRIIARAADGAMRDALSLLDQCSAYGEITEEVVSGLLGGGTGQKLFSLVQRIAEYDEKGALNALRALLDEGADTRTLIRDLADMFRRMMWLSTGAETEEQDAELAVLAKNFGSGACVRALDILLRKEYEMRLNLRADIVLETAVMGIMCPEDEHGAPDTLRIDKLEARLAALESRKWTEQPSEPTVKPEAKPVRAEASKKPVTVQPVTSKNEDILWKDVLGALKSKETYFIYTHAAKAKEAHFSENSLELVYSPEDSMSAEYMKQSAAQSAVLKKLEGKGTAFISVKLETKHGNTPDVGIQGLFGDDIDIEEV